MAASISLTRCADASGDEVVAFARMPATLLWNIQPSRQKLPIPRSGTNNLKSALKSAEQNDVPYLRTPNESLIT